MKFGAERASAREMEETYMAKRKGNGLGSTPVKIKRSGRPDTWGVRTPMHFDRAQQKEIRYWIGRDFETKTAAENALSEWIVQFKKGEIAPRSDLTVGQLLDRWLEGHRGEETTRSGYGPKVRLHIKPHVGDKKVVDVVDEDLNALYVLLGKVPAQTAGKPLGPASIRHIHHILSATFQTVTGPKKLLRDNPASTANPPTERQIKAATPEFPTLTNSETAKFLEQIWQPCGNRACDGGKAHHCRRDAALWTVYAATSCRRSEVLGMKWSLIDWDTGAIELRWVVVEEGNTFRLRRLTKDGDDKAVIYVDQSLLAILRWQKQRQEAERDRLGERWVEHDLVFARDGFKLHRSEAGGPQDPEKVSARWRTLRRRLRLPAEFRLHDLRASKITNDLDAHESPVEISANARHHSPGYTMTRYGRRRAEGAKKLAAASANRLGLATVL
ncbi:tyrosine-type recombinase/integrase [Streptomyces buecherae]|uniref:tyrosine-type recombinase/integrase n=1 Tax=Streptomyces buecherae TaxID=2763006 RepID=UPI0036CC1A7C